MKKILLVLSLILLFSCINEGHIIDKFTILAHYEEYTDYYTVIMSDGKTIQVPVQKKYFVPDKYYITIQGRNKKEKLEKRTITVTKTEYENLKINDYYRVTK